jgi:spatzle-processing enzyme
VAVRLGEWDTTTEQDCDQGENPEDTDCVEEPVQDIEIELIIPHTGFDPASTNVHNDIALLRLKTPAVLNFYVQPICLPRTEKLRTTSLDNLSLEVAGWGLTENRTKSSIKMKVGLKVVPMAQCTTIFPTRNIWNKQLCAGGVKGKDSCNGDSGGE